MEEGTIMLENTALDRSLSTPLYHQLKTILDEAIQSGEFPVGSCIPTEKQLSALYGVSRITVRQAIAELVQEGKFYRIKSKGTFVAAPKLDQEFATKLLTFNEDIRNNNQTPSTQVLEQDVRPMQPWLIEQAGCQADAQVVYLYRLRCANGEPVVRVKSYLPHDRCAHVLDYDLNQESLYDILGRDPDRKVVKVIRTCKAIAAAQEDEKLLHVKKGAPIHYFATYGYNRNGELMEYSEAFYRGDRNQFRMEISL